MQGNRGEVRARRGSDAQRLNGPELNPYESEFKGRTVEQWGMGLRARVFFDSWVGTSGGKLYEASKDASALEHIHSFAQEFELDEETLVKNCQLNRPLFERFAKTHLSEIDRYKILYFFEPCMWDKNSQHAAKYYTELGNLGERHETDPSCHDKVYHAFLNAIKAGSPATKEVFEKIRKGLATTAFKLTNNDVLDLAKNLSKEQLELLKEEANARKDEGVLRNYWLWLREVPAYQLSNSVLQSNKEQNAKMLKYAYGIKKKDPKKTFNYLRHIITHTDNREKTIKSVFALLNVCPLSSAMLGLMKDSFSADEISKIVALCIMHREYNVGYELCHLSLEMSGENTYQRSSALYNQAVFFQNGYGPVKKNIPQALELYIDALKYSNSDEGRTSCMRRIKEILARNELTDKEADIIAEKLKPKDALGLGNDCIDVLPSHSLKIYHALIRKQPTFIPPYLNIGILHYKGEKIPKDYAKALEYFLKAHETDPSRFEAINNINSILLSGGHGVERDTLKAAQYSAKIIESGTLRRFSPAMDKVITYTKGRGPMPELVKLWVQNIAEIVGSDEFDEEKVWQLGNSAEADTLGLVAERLYAEGKYEKALMLCKMGLRYHEFSEPVSQVLFQFHADGRLDLKTLLNEKGIDLPAEYVRALDDVVKVDAVETLKIMALSFDPDSAGEEDCYRQILIFQKINNLFETDSENRELPIEKGGKQARVNLNCARIKLAQLLKAKKGGKGPFLNISRLVNDPLKKQWDIMKPAYETVSDPLWIELSQSLEKTVAELFKGEEQKKLQELTLSFFRRSMESKDAETEAGAAFVRQRVATVINFALNCVTNNTQLERAKRVVKLMADGGTACPDRIITKLGEAERHIKMGEIAQKGQKDLLLSVLTDLFIHNAIQSQFVMLDPKKMVETYLYYMLQFSEALHLSAKTKNMLYRGVAHIEMDINKAVDYLFKAFTEKDLVGYISKQPEWRSLHEEAAKAFKGKRYELLGLVEDGKAIDETDKKRLLDFFEKDTLESLRRDLQDLEKGAAMDARWAERCESLTDEFYTEQAEKDLTEVGFLREQP